MAEHNALLGGESSGGLTIRGTSSARMASSLRPWWWRCWRVRARRFLRCSNGCAPSPGRLYDFEESLPATPEMRIVVPRRLKEAPCEQIGPYPVIGISHMDGTQTEA